MLHAAAVDLTGRRCQPRKWHDKG